MNCTIWKLVIASLLLVVPACASRSSSTAFDDTPTGRPSVTVEVRNQNFYPARIYAYRSGARRRLGEVQAHQTTSFSFEWALSDIRFLIDFLAAGCIFSHLMTVGDDDNLLLVLEPGDDRRARQDVCRR